MNKDMLASFLQKAQDIQSKFEKAKSELDATQVVGESGAGMVKITLNCANDIHKVEIDPTLLSDKEMLEDLIAAAFNDAQHKIRKITKEKMAENTAAMGIPPGLLDGVKFPF